MQILRTPATWVRLVIIFLVIAVSGISPQSQPASEALRAANLAIEANDPATAAKWLEIAAQHLPRRADLWEYAGQQAVLANNPSQAIEYFLTAADVGELTPAGQFALGHAYSALNEFDAAIAVWNSAIETENAPPEAYLLLASVYRDRGQYVLATSALESYVGLAPSDAQGHFELGLLYAVFDPRSASVQLIFAAELDEKYREEVNIMQSGLRSANFDDAPAYVHTLIGQSLAAIKRWDLAKQSFLLATESDATYPEAWAYLGAAKQELGEDGFPQLEVAWALNPNSLSANILLSLYWQGQNDMQRALEFLQYASELAPRNSALQADLGSLYLKIGELELAQEHYQRAAELSPASPVYWILLAKFSLEHELYLQESGLPAAKKAYDLSPNDPETITLIARVYHLLGEHDLSLSYYNQALSQFPEFTLAHLYLGLLYINQDNYTAAKQEFMLILQLEPDSENAIFAQKLLRQYFP